MSKQIPRKGKESEPAKKPVSLVPRPGRVLFDRRKIEAMRQLRGISSDEELAEGTTMSRQTLNRKLKMRDMRLEDLQSIANRLQTTPESLMMVSSFTQAEELPFEMKPPANWSILEVIFPPSNAGNGLCYCIAKLKSRLIEEQYARGKFYWLSGVDRRDMARLRECLSRHARVCERCINATRIARNRTVIPLGDDTAWWVLDHWIDAFPLESLLFPRQELAKSEIKHLGTEILLGLDELHSHGIVMRELTPDKVLVTKDRRSCTLTDFEMAILTQGAVSVSGRWKNRSPYLAPENVDDSDYNRKPEIVKSRDIYSWAAIMIECLTGDPAADLQQLTNSLSNAELAQFLIRCRHPRPDLRPKSVAEVQEVWSQWSTV